MPYRTTGMTGPTAQEVHSMMPVEVALMHDAHLAQACLFGQAFPTADGVVIFCFCERLCMALAVPASTPMAVKAKVTRKPMAWSFMAWLVACCVLVLMLG